MDFIMRIWYKPFIVWGICTKKELNIMIITMKEFQNFQKDTKIKRLNVK